MATNGIGVTVGDVDEAQYGYSVEVPEGYDEAIVRARLALRREGFSILSEMHVGGLLDGAGDGRQYLFLGAWSSSVASRPIGGDLRVAVHLPSNVVVHETGAGAIVAALDPADNVEVAEAADETVELARAALGRVLDMVRTG
ncbi:MAG: hypothetical protein QOH48_1235 [Actinomycetota bacterium]|jgi:uncharacterized protein (DUF302 family)|nr:hypothetical protein [Actinomycetota bacterium]